MTVGSENSSHSPYMQSGATPDRSLELLRALDQVLYITHDTVDQHQLALSKTAPANSSRIAGIVPVIQPESLGSRRFLDIHGLRFPYIAGAMANGIASAELVISMGKAGFMGFFGSGGISLEKIDEAIRQIQSQLISDPYGFNLLHNPFEPRVEMETVEIYLKRQVRRLEAAAFVQITPAVVLFRASGMRALPDGRVSAPNHIFAKVSRPELAARFMSPPPEAMLRELVASGRLRENEAKLAAQLPVADAITAEADSGGHTDQRPLSVLLPLVIHERQRLMDQHKYADLGAQIHIGAAGGIGEPLAASAAFTLGADYLVTGSINQASVEAGTSALTKEMLLEVDMADVAMAPAPDMFEMGARVQVLKRGTLYPQRAQKLFELYKTYPNFESIPEPEREKVEKQILQRSFSEVWAQTEAYWQKRDPSKAEEGRRDGKARMALCFRWYLGLASRWAAAGEPERRYDFQIWCGPALAAFNRWASGTWLEPLAARSAPAMAMAILYGAASYLRREAALRAGLDVPSALDVIKPWHPSQLGLVAQAA